MQQECKWKAIRIGKYGGFDVVGFREAEKWSVLAGHTLTIFLDNFQTEKEAREAYPDCIEGFVSGYTAPQVSTDHLQDEEYDDICGYGYPDILEDEY